MFEKFTEQAIKVIMLSQEEARRLGHNFVGTEQLLLGLIGEGTGIAARVLKSFGINLKDARIEVETIIGRGSGFVAVEIPFTPRAKRVLELSLAAARELGHNYIGTEHLLLGLISEGEGVAARVLENLGVDLGQLRARVIKAIENGISESTIRHTRNNSSQLETKIARLLAIFENAQYQGVELIDRIERELNKKEILNNDIAEILNSSPESSPEEQSEIKEFLTELQTAIETNTLLTSEAKEEALEMVLIIAEALQDLKDNRKQKLAISAFRILRSTIYKTMKNSKSIEDFQDISPKIPQRATQSVKPVNRIRFERFTEQAIKVIMLSQEEARRLGHNFVGTEQLLLGLIGEETGIAAKVLKSFSVNLENARVEAEKIIGRGSGNVGVEIPFTPRAKRVLELALEEVRKLKENYVYTEHLLLGLIRETEGVAARVLENLGVNLEQLQASLIEEMAKTEREKIIEDKEEYFYSLSLLSKRVDRVFSALDNVKDEVLKISDLVKEEIEKRSILNSYFADTLDRLPESSGIKEPLTRLKIAIETDTNLTSEDKEEALEIVIFLAQASLKLMDKEVQKYARTALKLLRGTILELPEDSQLVADCKDILPEIYKEFSFKEQPEIKEILNRLKTTIEIDTNLTPEDKAEALEQVTFLAQISLRPKNREVQKYARTALKILRETTVELPEDSQLVADCKDILPEISKIFSL